MPGFSSCNRGTEGGFQLASGIWNRITLCSERSSEPQERRRRLFQTGSQPALMRRGGRKFHMETGNLTKSWRGHGEGGGRLCPKAQGT